MRPSTFITALRNTSSDDKGVTAIEYGVLAALIILVSITIIGTLGNNLNTAFTNINTALAAAL